MDPKYEFPSLLFQKMPLQTYVGSLVQRNGKKHFIVVPMKWFIYTSI